MMSIPAFALDLAVEHALSMPEEEVCGMFVRWHGIVSYMPCTNRATNPQMNFVIDTVEIAELYTKFDLLVLFHSHPQSHSRPSRKDLQAFPRHYVDYGLILVGRDSWVWYDESGVLKSMDILADDQLVCMDVVPSSVGSR